MLRLTHVIDGLDVGGAEMMLFRLLTAEGDDDFEPDVVSLTDIGPVGRRLEERGVRVRSLGMTRHVADAARVARLVRWLHDDPPVLVQTWLYEADLIGAVAARVARSGAPVVWNIQQSNLDPERSKRHSLRFARACARMSRRLPARIICCSEVSARIHRDLGYCEEKMVVIPNGVDLETFAPDPEARRSVRRELGVAETAALVGVVARFDPQKDHRSFLTAAGIAGRGRPEVHFVLVGKGLTPGNDQVSRWIEAEGLDGRCHLIGLRDDVARLTAALDVAVSSSAYGEGFSLALGEAMACGVPCVVTDVGDSGLMVGPTGRTVAPGVPPALAQAIGELLDLGDGERRRLGRAARARAEDRFGLTSVVNRYRQLHRQVHAEATRSSIVSPGSGGRR